LDEIAAWIRLGAETRVRVLQACAQRRATLATGSRSVGS